MAGHNNNGKEEEPAGQPATMSRSQPAVNGNDKDEDETANRLGTTMIMRRIWTAYQRQ